MGVREDRSWKVPEWRRHSFLPDLEQEEPAHMDTHTLVVRLPGAKANIAKHSPVEATAVTTERLLSKYWDRMVTVGRKLKQNPRPVMGHRQDSENHMPADARSVHSKSWDLGACFRNDYIHGAQKFILEQRQAGLIRGLEKLQELFWETCKKKKRNRKICFVGFFFSLLFCSSPPPDLYNPQCTEPLSNTVFT